MLHELQARVQLMLVEREEGMPRRSFYDLPLELSQISFFPLTWTIVHPIDESSPLHGKDASALASLQAEFLVLIKGFDEPLSIAVSNMLQRTNRGLRIAAGRAVRSRWS